MRKILPALAAVAALVCAAPVAADEIQKIGSAAVTCATTATATDTAAVSNSSARYFSVCVPSDATVTVYVGDSDVTTSTGTALSAGDCWSSGVRMRKEKTPYCIVASGTQSVRVQESL